MVIPYWDWTIDYEDPANSIVLSNTYYGGNGVGRRGCVEDGAFAGFEAYYPYRHCLERDYDDGYSISSFASSWTVNSIVRYTSLYDSFRQAIESSPHARPHNNIGGDMMTMASPNDPLFWAHHAFIDKIWVEWQEKGSGYLYRYDGPGASLNQILRPWGVMVASVMDTRNLCYYYEEPSRRR